jgi:hypothetical protein
MYQQNVNGMSEYMGFMSGAEKFAGRKEAEELERRKIEAEISAAEAGASADIRRGRLYEAQAEALGKKDQEQDVYFLAGRNPATGEPLRDASPALQLGYLMASSDPDVSAARRAGAENERQAAAAMMAQQLAAEKQPDGSIGRRKGLTTRWGDDPKEDYEDMLRQLNPNNPIYEQRWAGNQARKEIPFTKRTNDDYIAGAHQLGIDPANFGFPLATPDPGEPKFTTVPEGKGLLTHEEQASALFGSGWQNLLAEGDPTGNMSVLGRQAGANPTAAATQGGIWGDVVGEIINTRGVNPDTGAEFRDMVELQKYVRRELNAALDRSKMLPSNKRRAKKAIGPLLRQLTTEGGLAESWGLPGGFVTLEQTPFREVGAALRPAARAVRGILE